MVGYRPDNPAVMVFRRRVIFTAVHGKSLLNGAATMDTLVALGTGVAWLYSMSVNPVHAVVPDGSATSLLRSQRDDYRSDQSQYICWKRAHASVLLRRWKKLLDLTPPTARLVTDEGEKSVPLAEVQPGMLLRLTTGDRVPVDGEITLWRSMAG